MMRKNIGILVVLAWTMASGTACVSLYYKAEAKKEVEQFKLDLPQLVRAKAENDPLSNNQVRSGFSARLQSAIKIEALLENLYTESDLSGFRFVAGYKTTPDHQALMALLKSVYQEGVNPKGFLIDQLETQAGALADHVASLAAPLPALLNDEQKERLIADLVEATRKDAAPELSGPPLLDWMLAPEREDIYPELHQAYKDLRRFVVKRGKAAYNTELDGAIAFFKYLRAMEVAEEPMLPTWNDSLGDFGAVAKAAIPNNPHYLRLRAELARYRKLALKDDPLWEIKVGYKAKIKKGKTGKIIKKVQGRLVEEGFYAGPVNGVFDEMTETALVEFQRTHQVVDDGVIGRGTTQAMSVPFSDRVRQLRLAMDRQRRSPTRYESYYFRVNVPEFIVEVVEDGKILRRHRVVVGNLMKINHTPEFQAPIKMVIYNPAWYMTRRIFEREELPKWEKDNEYFKKKGYIARENEEGIPISAYQPPGPRNALGRVKIIFPNRHEVYMHDTPSKYLFNRTLRHYSHGCVRLQNALEMAEFLLKKDKNAAAENIEDILSSRKTVKIDLNDEVLIFIEYNTVSTTDDGRAVFLKDIYKRDTKALAELESLS